MMYRAIGTALWVGFMVTAVARGETLPDWPAWRGPDASGHIRQGTYPDKFDANHFLWRVELPGKGCSTPILRSEQIFLTAPVDGNDALLCYGLDGSEQWRKTTWASRSSAHQYPSATGYSSAASSTCSASPQRIRQR